MAHIYGSLLAELRSTLVGCSVPAFVVAFHESKVVALCAEKTLVVCSRVELRAERAARLRRALAYDDHAHTTLVSVRRDVAAILPLYLSIAHNANAFSRPRHLADFYNRTKVHKITNSLLVFCSFCSPTTRFNLAEQLLVGAGENIGVN